jgi:endoglycosylceramidase
MSPDLGTRRNSAQVGAAFATFFDDLDAGSAGQTLRDRFTTMAMHVAAHFADDPAVFGFELYNEPISSDQNLHPFYLEVIPAMRAAAPNKLLLWEPSVIRNELDQASQGDGTAIGAGTVYAPHVYTNAFVGGSGFTEQSLSTSNYNARDEADSWGAPLVITEWGYGPTGDRFADYVHFQQDLQDQVRASAFFWLWKESSEGNWGFFDDSTGSLVERTDVVAAMARARVEAVSGVLESVAFDLTAQRLEVHFAGSAGVTGSNVVSIGTGATTPAAQWTATCDGQTVATGGEDPLQITCGGAGEHVLVVSGG